MGHYLTICKACFFAIAAGLAGCQTEGQASPPNLERGEQPTPPSYPFEFDVETPGGIFIQTNGHPIPPAEDIDRWYNEAQQCLADWYTVLYPGKTFEFVDPPPVVIVEDTRTLCGDGATGMYCRNYSTPFVGLNDGWARFYYKWKHEFQHHILTENGFSNELQLIHQPSQFWGMGGCEYQ